MNPIIGIVACGSTDQRQFVPQTYISAIEDAGGIPAVSYTHLTLPTILRV